ncbi:MAG: integrase core domain-containing protein [Micromonosporaceae bacterium]
MSTAPTAAWRRWLLPPRARRANAICERVVGTLRRELLNRILIAGPGHLRRILAEYTIHYNAHRPHQSLNQQHPDTDTAMPAPITDLTGRRIRRRPILGGLINEYESAWASQRSRSSTAPLLFSCGTGRAPPSARLTPVARTRSCPWHWGPSRAGLDPVVQPTGRILVGVDEDLRRHIP